MASPSEKPCLPPVFICMILVEEHPSGAQPGAASSSGAHSGSSPPPSMSSGASIDSQDSAICASSSPGSSSPLPPPDPGQPTAAQPTTSGTVNVNGPQIQMALLPVDTFLLPSDASATNEPSIHGESVRFVRLDLRNAFEQLEKISQEIGQNFPGRQGWLVCSRRAIRQSLYPHCAQALLAKLTEEGEEQVFSARLPLPALFRRFLPFPPANHSPMEEDSAVVEKTPPAPEASNTEMVLQRQLYQMATTLLKSPVGQQACKNGFLEPEKWMESVQQGYKPALCKEGPISSRTIVRARGLPWQVSDLDVALFFAGLEIAHGGVVLCLGPEGRRNGECLVRFERPEHRDWALERHRRHLRQRYIEVYRANAEDFILHAIGTDPYALEFAQRAEQHQQRSQNQVTEFEADDSNQHAMIVRMRGLPFTATEQQIRDFFASDGLPSGILDGGVLFVHRTDGRPSGDAFVLFGDEQSGRRALQKHRQRMGSRYIELFRTTQAEVQQLFNARQQAVLNGAGQQQQNMTNGAIGTHPRPTTLPALPVLALGGGGTGIGGLVHQNGTVPPAGQQQSRQRDCLRLRGLPYEAQVQQVVEFLGTHARHVLYQGVHMIYNAAGHPSGEAFIQMESEQAAILAAQDCHNKFMELGKKRRYIEVFQCCHDDMSLLLNVLPTANGANSGTPTNGGGGQGQPVTTVGNGLLPAPPMATVAGNVPPPLLPLASAPPFTPTSACGMPTPSPLLAFPTATGPFLTPAAFGPGTPTDPTAMLFTPQFAPIAHLYTPDSPAFAGPMIPPEFWLRNGLIRNGALPIANPFAPAPLFPFHTAIAAVNGNGGGGGQQFVGPSAETAVKMT